MNQFERGGEAPKPTEEGSSPDPKDSKRKYKRSKKAKMQSGSDLQEDEGLVKMKSVVSQILPDKTVLGKVMWSIIQNQPFSLWTYSASLAVEEVSQIFIAQILAFSTNEGQLYLSQSSDSQSGETSSLHGIALIALSSMAGLYLSLFLAIYYLYRELKANEEADQEPLPQILCKILSLFFTLHGTFVNLGITFLEVWSFYLVGSSSSLQQQANISLIVLTVILIVETLTFTFFYDSFFNLNFQNEILINSRRKSSHKFTLLKPLYFFLLCILSLQESPSDLQRVLYLALFASLNITQLFYATTVRTYFNPKIEQNHITMKVVKSAGMISLAFTAGFSLSLSAALLLLVIVLPCVYGVAHYLQERKEAILYDKLSNAGVGVFKSQSELEHILVLAIEYLESEEPRMHCKFQGLLIVNEKKVSDSNQSYLQALNKVITIHERLVNLNYFHNNNGQDLDQNQLLLQAQFNNEEGTQIYRAQTLNDETFPEKAGHEDSIMPNSTLFLGHQASSNAQKSDTQNESPQMLNKRSSSNVFNLLQGQATKVSQVALGGLPDIIQQMNQRLDDIFQSKGNGSARRNQVTSNQRNQHILNINGFDTDLGNLDQAIKIVKMRFFYEVLVKQAQAKFPESMFFMLLKAQLSLDKFQNKYLTLTAVTHLNNLQKKLSYKENLQLQIYINYFLKAILANVTNGNATGSKGTPSNGNSSGELDSTVLLDQTLKIDEVINCIKQCSLKITIFWQLASHENVTIAHITKLELVSLQISESLRLIRNYVKQMESIDSFESTCQTLFYYISYFFIVVVRDRYVGQSIMKQMLTVQQFRGSSQMILVDNTAGNKGEESQSQQSLVDLVGVVVVDGNFNLYGKILFANKIIVRLLGYQDNEIQGKLIHSLMPTQVAEVHNIFWTSFAQVGVPKVLDSLRHLFVKDADGYVTPFKIFIKFQFSIKFGYSFVGLFLKPNTVLFDDQQTVNLKKTYQMICNEKGKVVEISSSIAKLLKIKPKILEQLHSNLSENFNISIFNKAELNIPRMDFSKHSCIFFKQIEINLMELKQVSCNLEILDENEEQVVNPFLALPDSMMVSMKIIKETYGSTNSTLVTLYYVIFTNKVFDSIQVLSSDINNTNQQKAESMNITKKNLVEDDSEIDLDININVQSGSNDEDSILNTASVSSASSSASQTKNQDIKYVEEGIDYHKTPKPLIYLQLSTVFLFVSLMVLASVQYGLNQSYQKQNLEYQQILIQTVQNQEMLSHLTLMTRSYVNINLGFEPDNTDFVPNTGRKFMLREKALNYIERIRLNLQHLHDFFLTQKFPSSQIQNGVQESQQISANIVEMYSIFSNNKLKMNTLSRLNALSTWLVNIYQIFVLDNFVSNVGTFTQSNVFQMSNATNFDQTLFYVLINAQSDMKDSFEILSSVSQQLIVNQVSYSVEMNKYYVAVTSFLVVSLTAGSLYLITVVFRFKARVLTFFAEIDPETMHFNENCANDFYEYITTDNKSIIKDCINRIDEYTEMKQEVNRQVLNQQQAEQRSRHQSHFNNSFASDEESHHKRTIPKKESSKTEKHHKKGKGNDPIVGYHSKRNDPSMISIEKMSEDEEEEEEKYSEDHIGKDLNKQTSFVDIIKNGKKRKRTQGELKAKMTPIENIYLNQRSLQGAESKLSNNSGLPNVALNQGSTANPKVRNKEIELRLNEITGKKITNVVIAGIIAAIFFTAYFVAQYLVFSSNELNVQANSLQLRSLIESMECTDSFILQVRTLQVSNNSWYDLSKSAVNRHLNFLPSTAQSKTLNQTYQDCIVKNQAVNQWLTVYQGGQFLIQQESAQNVNNTFCSSLAKLNQTTPFNQSACENIYSGVLQRSVLQQTSVFLQDELYTAINFMSPQSVSLRSTQFIIGQLGTSKSIELLDAYIQFQQTGLQDLYTTVINFVMASQSQQAITVLYILFASILLIAFLVIVCYLIQRIKLSFWHAFYILRLVPTEDVDRDFIKRINDYLSQA